MSDDFLDRAYTVSFKTHPGYDASLIVVRGDTVEELEANTKALHDSFLETVAETEGLIRAQRLANGHEDAPAAPAQEQSSGNVTAIKTCAHGKRTRREGSTNGGWVGYFCPLRKGDPDQCKPIFEDAK